MTRMPKATSVSMRSLAFGISALSPCSDFSPAERHFPGSELSPIERRHISEPSPVERHPHFELAIPSGRERHGHWLRPGDVVFGRVGSSTRMPKLSCSSLDFLFFVC